MVLLRREFASIQIISIYHSLTGQSKNREERDMKMDKKVRDEIARVAYELYEKRGYTPGNDFMDWLEAEKIVKQKYSKGMAGIVEAIRPTQLLKAIETAKSKSREILTRPLMK